MLLSNHKQMPQAYFGIPEKNIEGATVVLKKCKIKYTSTRVMTSGSRWVYKNAKFIKKLNFLGFCICFSIIMEQTSKNTAKLHNIAQY